MLVVKDFKKLKAHGFKQNLGEGLKKNENGNPIWFKQIAEDEYGNYISLLVNPYHEDCAKNEMTIYSSIECDNGGVDVCARIDEVFDMLADGTIELVKER